MHKSLMTETELTERCRAGENAARKELYERYAGQLLGICYRYVGEKDTAEDLLHDGFIKAFDSFNKFSYRGEGSLRAWLSRLMVNVALDYLRKNEITRYMLAIEDAPETASEPPEEDISIIPKDILAKFIAELPVGYRTVLNLSVMEELSHREIADQLGIKERTSSSQLFRAKQVLAKRINEYVREHRI